MSSRKWVKGRILQDFSCTFDQVLTNFLLKCCTVIIKLRVRASTQHSKIGTLKFKSGPAGWGAAIVSGCLQQKRQKRLRSDSRTYAKISIRVLSREQEKTRQRRKFRLNESDWKSKYNPESNSLSFYRSQNVLVWSKFFVTDQKFICILWQSQTFCARQKDDLHSGKLVFVPAQKFLKRH